MESNNFLYTNPKGKPVTIHSYSAGQEFQNCRRKYKLSRIDGWKEKEKRASFEFGKCIEDSIRFFHESGMKMGASGEEFTRLWIKYQDNKELTYTDKESSWENMHQMGIEMMALYEINLPSFPIYKPQFQLSYRKEVFPNSELSGLEFIAYIDMLVKRPEDEPMIIDIKTASQELDETPNILSLDSQLCAYGWVSGILNVGFIWFTKSKIGPYKKGDEVTLLAKTFFNGIGLTDPGEHFTVLEHDVESGTVKMVRPQDFIPLCEELAAITGKGSTAKKSDLIQNYQDKGKLFFPDAKAVTKQRLQFVTARLNPDDVKEMGEAIGQEIIDIADASERNFFPKEPSIRGLLKKCQMCCMLGICLGDKKIRDERVIRINSDWLDEIEDEG